MQGLRWLQGKGVLHGLRSLKGRAKKSPVEVRYEVQLGVKVLFLNRYEGFVFSSGRGHSN